VYVWRVCYNRLCGGCVTTALHECYNRFTCVRLASVANCEGEGVSKEEKQQEHESRRIFILG
jgi:hypothetical protein